MRLSARAMLWFLVWFVIAAAVIHLLLWFVMKQMASDVRPAVDRPANLVEPSAAEVAAAPPLQPSTGHDVLPREDLARMREGEDVVFERLGWTVDRRTGLAKVPASVVQAVARRTAAAADTRPSTMPSGGGAR
jgi:hypothetical protein